MLKMGLNLVFLIGMTTASTNVFAAEICGTLLNRCSQCHDKERICDNVGRSEKYWKGTLKYMISNGAEISTDESLVMATCLSSKADEAQKFCK